MILIKSDSQPLNGNQIKYRNNYNFKYSFSPQIPFFLQKDEQLALRKVLSSSEKVSNDYNQIRTNYDLLKLEMDQIEANKTGLVCLTIILSICSP